MRVLLDSCVWGGSKKNLIANGHDVEWAGDWPKDPGDDEILARARSESRILVTLDKDFGELAIIRGIPHCGIMRLVNISATRQGQVCSHVLTLHGDELLIGAIVTVSENRIRIRPAQID